MEKRILINQYLAHIYEYAKFAVLFFLVTFEFKGFSITTPFFDENFILSHVERHTFVLAFLILSLFIVYRIADFQFNAQLFLDAFPKKTYINYPINQIKKKTYGSV